MVGKLLVFYDDVCATCHGLVRFILGRPKVARERFHFLPVSSLRGTVFASKGDTRSRRVEGDSLVVVKDGLAFQKSDAVFVLFEALGMPWRLLVVLRLVPRSISDALYDAFARRRYSLFGKADPRELCELPDPELRKFFATDVLSELAGATTNPPAK